MHVGVATAQDAQPEAPPPPLQSVQPLQPVDPAPAPQPSAAAPVAASPATERVAANSVPHRTGAGLLAAAGFHTGLALGARAGTGTIGVELTGGYQLIYAMWNRLPGSDRLPIQFGWSGQFGAEVYFTPWHPIATSAIGLRGGYRYSAVLEHGFAIALAFLFSLGDYFAMEISMGSQAFPGSTGRLRRSLEVPEEAELAAINSSYQFFEYGFELICYPWK
jgi:hypothetical protein